MGVAPVFAPTPVSQRSGRAQEQYQPPGARRAPLNSAIKASSVSHRPPASQGRLKIPAGPVPFPHRRRLPARDFARGSAAVSTWKRPFGAGKRRTMLPTASSALAAGPSPRRMRAFPRGNAISVVYVCYYAGVGGPVRSSRSGEGGRRSPWNQSAIGAKYCSPRQASTASAAPGCSIKKTPSPVGAPQLKQAVTESTETGLNRRQSTQKLAKDLDCLTPS
jgi:hypothetical protein